MRHNSEFFTLNRETDWLQGKSYNLQVSDQGITVDTIEKYVVEDTIRLMKSGVLQDLHDLSLGFENKLLLMDTMANVWLCDPKTEQISAFISNGRELFSPYSILTYIEGIVVVGDCFGERGVAAFSQINGQLVWQLESYGEVPLVPIALTAESSVTDKSGCIYVLSPDKVEWNGQDRMVPEGAKLFIWKIDRSGRPVNYFTHSSLVISTPTLLRSLTEKYVLACSQQEQCSLINKESGTCYLFGSDSKLQSFFSFLPYMKVASIAFHDNQCLLVGDNRDVVSERGILQYESTGVFRSSVPIFHGKSDKILVGNGQRLFVWNKEDQTVTALSFRNRTKPLYAGGSHEGMYFSTSFDSTEAETVWHKFTLDMFSGDESQIIVRYYASDRKEHLLNGQVVNLDEYICNDDIPINTKLEVLQPLWLNPQVNPNDALFFNTKGRYLWIFLRLSGTELSAPSIQRLKVYYPRSTFLSYLPAVYQNNPQSRDFLERFLSLFNTLYDDLEHKIDHISTYFDPDTVAGPYLKWLSGWLGVMENEGWEDAKLRIWIKESQQLYKCRGTKQGLERMVEIITGSKPWIVEHFQYKRFMEIEEIHSLLERLYGNNPYGFCVLVRAEHVQHAADLHLVQKIVEQEKPAHTEARLVILQPWMFIGMHSYMEINTRLSEPRIMVLEKDTTIPLHTVLTDPELDRRLGSHSRLDMESTLE